jgi:hypothetical protein
MAVRETPMSFFDGLDGSSEGLVVGGWPSGSATLVLGPEAATVRLRDHATVLPWSEHGSAWRFAYFISGSSANIDAMFAVDATGAYGKRLQLVWDEVPHGIVARALSSSRRDKSDGCRVVILTTASAGITQIAETWTIWVLCCVLAEHESIRQRIGDPKRVSRLASDMRAGPRRGITRAKLHLNPTKAAIASVMTASGLTFHYGGRPVPGLTKIAPREQTIDALRLTLRTSPYYRTMRTPSAKAVGKVLDRDCLNIGAWPFAAITCEELAPISATAPTRQLMWSDRIAHFMAPRGRGPYGNAPTDADEAW